MPGRGRVAMDESEVRSFLEANLKVQVAAIGAEGVPHLTTLFYTLDDGRIAFWTYGKSQKIVHLERDPRVSVLVEDGVEYGELRGVSITGRAELVRDHDRIVDIGSRVVTRMTGVATFEELGDIGREGVERQARKRVAVVIHPEHVATWDHRKLA